VSIPQTWDAFNVISLQQEAIGTKLIMLYSETISLSDKVNKLTESVGPAGFSLTKEAIVTEDRFRLHPPLTDSTG